MIVFLITVVFIIPPILIGGAWLLKPKTKSAIEDINRYEKCLAHIAALEHDLGLCLDGCKYCPRPIVQMPAPQPSARPTGAVEVANEGVYLTTGGKTYGPYRGTNDANLRNEMPSLIQQVYDKQVEIALNSNRYGYMSVSETREMLDKSLANYPPKRYDRHMTDNTMQIITPAITSIL